MVLIIGNLIYMRIVKVQFCFYKHGCVTERLIKSSSVPVPDFLTSEIWTNKHTPSCVSHKINLMM